MVASSVTYPFTIKLSYVEETDGGYAGKASYYLRETTGVESNCPSGGANPTGTTKAGTMVFTRADGATNVKLMLNQGTFCGDQYDPLTLSDGVDVCDAATGANIDSTSDADNGWGGNWNYINFDFNPSTEAGTYAYAWQAGRGDARSRVFNVNKTSTSVATAYFGFGPDVRDNTGACTGRDADLGKIKGMICNWAGPGNSHTYQDFTQRQAITKTAGVWTMTDEDILYNLVNDCSTISGLTWFSHAHGSATHLSYTNDSDVNTGHTVDLYALTDYQAAFTRPAEPTF